MRMFVCPHHVLVGMDRACRRHDESILQEKGSGLFENSRASLTATLLCAVLVQVWQVGFH